MLLAIDIGNTNIVFGVYEGGAWRHHWRVQTVRDRMPDEYAVLFQGFLQGAGLEFGAFEQVVLSSVVPQLTRGIAEMVAEQIQHPPLVIQPPDTPTGIVIDIEHPSRIGSDLVANAVAAYDYFKADCIVVDFGTATTFTAVAAPGVLRGVAIAAGLNTTANALASNAAQLPFIDLAPPPSVIGRNTVHAMQAGLVLGYVAMVEGLIDRMRAELGGASVVATGGLARVIGPLTDRF
ncbi:MAG: type III pantothenate kinase, partial [Anaerolineae bacterium]|nr:type III pantothenate kinase [Anaerolineae bacterium]